MTDLALTSIHALASAAVLSKIIVNRIRLKEICLLGSIYCEVLVLEVQKSRTVEPSQVSQPTQPFRRVLQAAVEMPKIQVISRTVGDRQGYHRNFSRQEHRFARGREYIRAVRAAKLEQLHAKPFVAAFDGHVETVCKLTKVRNKLPTLISGDWDGELRCWDISQHLLNWRVQAHRGRIMGCTTTNTTSSSDDFSSSRNITR